MSNAVQTINHSPAITSSEVMTPMDMLNRAVEQGANIEVIAKLMDLRDRYEAGEARKAFDDAVSAAKAEIPPVIKNRKGHNSKYADFAAIAQAVDPILSKYGLSYRFRTAQADRISVTCVLSHKFGHSEETTLSAPADTSGSKNEIQAIGSSLTYLQRYTLTAALGISTTDDDDGASTSPATSKINQDQIDQIVDLLEATGSDKAKFCAFLKIERLADLPAGDFKRAIAALNKKAARS